VDNQAESINNFFRSGDLDTKPQWLENNEQGIEYNPEELNEAETQEQEEPAEEFEE